jgi:hypothetical protein
VELKPEFGFFFPRTEPEPDPGFLFFGGTREQEVVPNFLEELEPEVLDKRQEPPNTSQSQLRTDEKKWIEMDRPKVQNAANTLLLVYAQRQNR